MRKYFSYLFFASLLFSSCKKYPQELIVGTWDIQSVTFNDEEKKDDPALMGIVKYKGSYDPYWQEEYNSNGSLQAKNGNDDNVMSVYLTFLPEKPDTIIFGGSNLRISGSFLPGMIDSLLGSGQFGTIDYWRIIEFTKHKLNIELLYQGNTYRLDMKKE